MKVFRPTYLTGLALLLAALGSEARAGQLLFDYTVVVAANTVAVDGMNGGSGMIGTSALTGQTGEANPAPSSSGASDAIGGYTFHYSGGVLPAFVEITGTITYDVTLTDIASGGMHTFVVTATFNNLYTQGNVTPIPDIASTGGDSATIGNYSYRLNATSSGTNIHVPGSAIFVGFEYGAVPEPTSMALLGIGMTSFLAFRRFFKRGVIA